MAREEVQNMQANQSWIDKIQALLESADYRVEQDNDTLQVYLKDTETLVLRLSLHSDADEPERCFVHFDMPLEMHIPEQHWLKAAEEIMAFNRATPVGHFSLSEAAQPYLDYRLPVPAHGEFMLNLIEVVQLSFLFARHLAERLQQKLGDWLSQAKSNGRGNGLASVSP